MGKLMPEPQYDVERALLSSAGELLKRAALYLRLRNLCGVPGNPRKWNYVIEKLRADCEKLRIEMGD